MRDSAATRVATERLRAEDQRETLAADAHADVIVLDGDPLEDIGLLADPAAHMALVIQAGARVGLLHALRAVFGIRAQLDSGRQLRTLQGSAHRHERAFVVSTGCAQIDQVCVGLRQLLHAPATTYSGGSGAASAYSHAARCVPLTIPPRRRVWLTAPTRQELSESF